MKVYFKVFVLLIIGSIGNCKSQNIKINDPLIAKDTSNVRERNNKLFVFVGEKMEITPLPYTPGDFDAGIIARYRVIQKVYGDYASDEIEFIAYDHYGTFPFKEFKNVLLFVREHEGRYYHEKYMFNDVYKTRDGRWAGPFDKYDYDHDLNMNTKVKPVKIDFIEEVFYPTKYMLGDSLVTRSFPEPYYKTFNDKAFVVYGNYVEELFQLKKEGVLTARKLFGDEQ